jgi:hypothetical protein
MKQMRLAATSLLVLPLRSYSLSLSSYLGGHTSGAQRSEQASLRAAFTILWKEILRGAQNDGYGAPPFSVILNGGCRSEESLTTSATSVTQSLKESRVKRAEHASLRPAFSLSALFQIPLPVQRLSIFSVFRKAVPRQCSTFLLDRAPRSRKSTASVQGEGKRAWRARVRAVATPFDRAAATLHSSQHSAKTKHGHALS